MRWELAKAYSRMTGISPLKCSRLLRKVGRSAVTRDEVIEEHRADGTVHYLEGEPEMF